MNYAKQGLVKDGRLAGLLAGTGQHGAVLTAFAAELAAAEWRLYEVRRVARADRNGKPSYSRSVRSAASGTRAGMGAALGALATRLGLPVTSPDGIDRVHLAVARARLVHQLRVRVPAPPGPADLQGGGGLRPPPGRSSVKFVPRFLRRACNQARLRRFRTSGRVPG